MGMPPARLCPYSPKSSIPSGRGWASASLKLARQAHSATSARIVVAVLRPLPSARPGLATRRRAIQHSAGETRDRSRSEARLSKRWEWAVPISCRRPASPFSVDSSCSLDQRKSVWALRSWLPDIQAGPDRLDPPTRRAGRVHHQQAAGSQQQGATFSGAWATRTASSSRSADRDQCAPALARAVPMPIRFMGFESQSTGLSVMSEASTEQTGANGPNANDR